MPKTYTEVEVKVEEVVKGQTVRLTGGAVFVVRFVRTESGYVYLYDGSEGEPRALPVGSTAFVITEVDEEHKYKYGVVTTDTGRTIRARRTMQLDGPVIQVKVPGLDVWADAKDWSDTFEANSDDDELQAVQACELQIGDKIVNVGSVGSRVRVGVFVVVRVTSMTWSLADRVRHSVSREITLHATDAVLLDKS